MKTLQRWPILLIILLFCSIRGEAKVNITAGGGYGNSYGGFGGQVFSMMRKPDTGGSF